jgi:hypothetical protein
MDWPFRKRTPCRAPEIIVVRIVVGMAIRTPVPKSTIRIELPID